MVYEAVRIHSPNPSKQKNYTFICDSHTVFTVVTVVTATPAVVRKWVGTIRHKYRHQLRRGSLVVGLGVQWPPCGADAAPATLQLCVGRHCLIFQLRYADRSPAALHRFLSEPEVTFAGVWNYRDACMLRESKHRLRISRLVDVRETASELRGCSRRASMGGLAAEILGIDGAEKKGWVGRSNWDEEWLSTDQVEYACLDVFLVFLMAKVLKLWNWD